jgi:hypothetical protein
MPDVFYVDSDQCLTASLDAPPDTRGGLFALEPFASISDVVESAEQCYPLRDHIENVHSELWNNLASIVTDICSQDITTEQELADLQNFGEPSDFEKLTDFLILEDPIIRLFNDWLASEPDGEDWEHGDETVDGYRSAFVFFEENREISETLGIKIIEGRRPGDNTQVAELSVSIVEANKRAQAAGLDIVMQDIEYPN